MLVRKSAVNTARLEIRRLDKVVAQQNKELAFRAEAYGRLRRRYLELEGDYQALETEFRQLKLSLPTRDARGRFSKR
ncbi:hypothetical protein EF910_05360 [Streptomyces sp. WAC07149]|uniref:hypothetical protein n=1 Tax=Streptomyces sp. WAC07149 TaxID=2487425 RepID=UPI000F793373|nr:hypothetical protein [Streptomyces sp. WAC07149]RST07867.1 hypothetical protein EF910_05360 [Streptomyces sp. WAC07149]